MVNWWPEPHAFGATPSDSEREIAGGPIYILKAVQAKYRDVDIVPVTARCKDEDLPRMGWDHGDILMALKSFTEFDYKGSQWAKSSNGIYLRCDVYGNKRYWDGTRHFDLYIKFALSNNGMIVMIVSCHD